MKINMYICEIKHVSKFKLPFDVGSQLWFIVEMIPESLVSIGCCLYREMGRACEWANQSRAYVEAWLWFTSCSSNLL